MTKCVLVVEFIFNNIIETVTKNKKIYKFIYLYYSLKLNNWLFKKVDIIDRNKKLY